MPPALETTDEIVDRWLDRFERALAAGDDAALGALFHADSHWRDVLALTWDIRTFDGLDAIRHALVKHVHRAKPTRLERDRTRTHGGIPSCRGHREWEGA